jgi:hypothetical protein
VVRWALSNAAVNEMDPGASADSRMTTTWSGELTNVSRR